VSITRYKLLAVGEIVNRGIVYVAISFVATALFCLLVGLATAMVGTYYFRWENAVMAGTTAMVVAISLGWIRDRFQRAIDVRFQRENYRLDIAVRRLSDAVDHLVEPAQLARQLMQSAQDTIGSSAAAVYLRDASHDHFELVCQNAWPQAPRRLAGDCPLVVDLAARSLACDGRPLTELSAAAGCVLESEGSAVGLVLLGPKTSGKALASEDRTFLLALARTAALALRGTQGYRTINSLKEDLQQKVQKIAEQQRRIMILQGELLNRGAASSAQPVVRPPAVELKHELRGSGPAVRQLLAQVAKIADSPSSVLIRGESGTGKELLARAIHQNSPRAGKPFVQVHCAALSAGLLESELFGHVRGAFTGADRDRAGRFELADGGTLFLDEVGDINLETQTKLLRVLQERAFERVGGMTTLEVDVRLIAATHQNLEALMRTGRFREDLFYRLNVISLRSPSLRERREDIFELALYFLQLHAARCGKRIARIDDDAVETLMDYGWPGNVRQLENAIERAVVLAEGETIGIGDLPPEIIEPSRLVLAASGASFDAATSEREASSGLDQTLALVERERLVTALAECGGNKSQAARRLGIPRTTLFSKLRRHGLE
jgi:transcriptional regulator with GAF, ATPase, and Fis domain